MGAAEGVAVLGLLAVEQRARSSPLIHTEYPGNCHRQTAHLTQTDANKQLLISLLIKLLQVVLKLLSAANVSPTS